MRVLGLSKWTTEFIKIHCSLCHLLRCTRSLTIDFKLILLIFHRIYIISQTFNRSQYKKNLRQKLRRTDRQGKIDQQTHDDIRNYLMLEVVLANRQRASAVANMTVENQIRARKQRNSEGEDMWTMLVSDHKTVTTYGAATLALNTELFTDLTFYIEEIR